MMVRNYCIAKCKTFFEAIFFAIQNIYVSSNPGSECVLARNLGLNVLLSVKEGWGVLCNNQKEFREDKESKTIMNKT